VKALVTVGGEGTRLRPHSGGVNKHFLPVGNGRVITRVLESLARAGVADIALATNPQDEKLRIAPELAQTLGLRITNIPIRASHGIPEMIWAAREFLAGGPFVLHLGDNLFGEGLEHALDDYRRAGEPTALLSLADGNPQGKFGGARIRDGRVHELVEKPLATDFDKITTGLYIYGPRTLAALGEASRVADLPDDISRFNQYLLRCGERLVHRSIGSWWYDIGSVEDLLRANASILGNAQPVVLGTVDDKSTIEGPVFVASGARIMASHIHGPAVIGGDACVENSRVGPNAIVGPGQVVLDSVVVDRLVFGSSTA
jgi:glucose-1-phosphate thymidylyltransferase